MQLSGCLDALTTVERRVLVLRTGLGKAHPHSRRGVARLLDLRVRRVVKIERRGLREARSLARAGACSTGTGASGSTAAGVSALASSGSGSGSGGGGADGGLVPEPSKSGGAGGGSTSSSDSSTGSGEVRGESETRLPPPLGSGGGAEPGGVSLAIGIFLIVLALVAGFATPHLRGRLRSS